MSYEKEYLANFSEILATQKTQGKNDGKPSASEILVKEEPEEPVIELESVDPEKLLFHSIDSMDNIQEEIKNKPEEMQSYATDDFAFGHQQNQATSKTPIQPGPSPAKRSHYDEASTIRSATFQPGVNRKRQVDQIDPISMQFILSL